MIMEEKMNKAGWELVKTELVPFEENDVARNIVLSFLNSKSRKTTSYKFSFFKSILDNLFNVDGDLIIYIRDLNYIFSKFIGI